MQRSIPIACLALAMLSARPARAQQHQRVRRQRDVITAEEIATRPGLGTAYEVVRNLRPAWLTYHGLATSGGASGGLTVYRDGVRIGGTDELRNISADEIRELRFLSANDATTKYGTGNANGAIEVTMKR